MEGELSESIIKRSFQRMIESYDTKSFPNLQKAQAADSGTKMVNDELQSFQSNFCSPTCYGKFLKVLRKIKEGTVDLSKITWENKSEANFIRDLVNNYYTAGYTMGYNQGIQADKKVEENID